MKIVLNILKLFGIMILIHYFSFYLAPLLAYFIYFHFDIDFGLNAGFDLFYKKTVILISTIIFLYELTKLLFKFFLFNIHGKIVFSIILIIIFIINNCL